MIINKELREIIRNSQLYTNFTEWADEYALCCGSGKSSPKNAIKYAEEKLNNLVRAIQTYLGED